MQLFNKLKVFIKSYLVRLAQSYCCDKCNHLSANTISEEHILEPPNLLTNEVSVFHGGFEYNFLTDAISSRENMDSLVKNNQNYCNSNYEDILFSIISKKSTSQ